MRWLLLPVLLLAGTQDKKTVAIKFQPAAGDRIRFEEIRTTTLHDPPIPGPRGAQRGGDYMIQKQIRGTVEFNEVKEGKLLRKTVDIAEHLHSDKLPWEKAPVTEKGPLHQRKITIQDSNGKLIHQGVHGLDEATLSGLTMALANEYVELFPRDPVRIGDFWKIVDKDSGIPQGEVKFDTGFVFMTLKDIRVIDERRCAVITVEQETSSLLKIRDSKVSIWVDTFQGGEMIVWIDRGYMLSMSVKGKVKMKAQKGAEEIDAEGETSQDITATLDPAK